MRSKIVESYVEYRIKKLSGRLYFINDLDERRKTIEEIEHLKSLTKEKASDLVVLLNVIA